MVCNAIPVSDNLSHGPCQDTSVALERDFCLGWGSTWSILDPLRRSYTEAVELVDDLANDKVGKWHWTDIQECVSGCAQVAPTSTGETWIYNLQSFICWPGGGWEDYAGGVPLGCAQRPKFCPSQG